MVRTYYLVRETGTTKFTTKEDGVMATKEKAIEKLLWSVALPGFGQLLNRKFLKGLLLIVLEFLINVNANLNHVIVDSYHGNIQEAIAETNFSWLMFYPCVYTFSMWDAYRDAGGNTKPYSFLPFVMAAYISTIGLIYSPKFTVMGVLLGPVFLPILSIFAGMLVGYLIQRFLNRARKGDANG